MAIESIYKGKHCEWLDVEAPSDDDLRFLHDRYEINSMLLDDTKDASHLPKFEQDGDVQFFLAREITETKRNGLTTITDISTKLSIFIVGKLSSPFTGPIISVLQNASKK